MTSRSDRDGAARARLSSRLAANDAGCLEYQCELDGGGYGQLRHGGKVRRAHRLAWELTRGPVPDGAFVYHRCGNRSCCNVEHLFLGERRHHVGAMVAGRARARAAVPPDAVRLCTKGHQMVLGGDGKRRCVGCRRLRALAASRRAATAEGAGA